MLIRGILIFILGLIYGFGVGLIWFNIILEKQFKKQPKVKSIEINLSELLKQMGEENK